jgi:metal-dependent HD superfamily phosphatase/phosphodiesterase
MTVDDAEVAVLLTSMTRDLEMSFIREGHEVLSVGLAGEILCKYLP